MSALSMRERIAAKRGDIAANKSKGIRPYKFKNGKTLFRILPDKAGGDWWRNFGQLYLKSFDGQQMVVIGDRYVTHGQSEPLRDMIFDAMRAAGPDQSTKDHFKEMLGGTRALFNALILNDPNQAPGEPVLIEISETQLDAILGQFEIYFEANGDAYDLSSLAHGHVFQVERSGTTKNDTEYNYNALPKTAPLGQAIMDKVIDMDGWIASLFEAKEEKALGLLQSMGVNVGNASSVSAVLTAGKSAGAIGTTAPQQPATAPASMPGAVTHAIDDVEADVAAALAAIDGGAAAPVTPAATAPVKPVVEEAVFEPVTPPAAPVTPAAPVQPAAAPATAPAAAEADDLASILAALN